MAEIQTNTSNNRAGVKRSKKLSTRVDLTPMVDLGFLLITFFIFTTTMSEPKAMTLVMPDDKNIIDNTLVPESKTLNVILEDNNKIYYYNGNDSLHKYETDYSAKGLRTIVQNKQKQVEGKFGKKDEAIILIHPTSKASYENVINALDEMTINDVKHFVLMND